MRRVHIGLLAALSVPVCALLIGCGGVIDRDEGPLPSQKKDKAKGNQAGIPAVVLKPVQGKYEGKITGSVKWVGAKPDLEEMTRKLQAGMNTDRDYCLTGKKPGETEAASPVLPFETFEQSYRIGDNGNLGNVFVWIAPAERGFAFDVPDAQLPANKEVVISQPHCAFLPHCSAVFAARYKGGKLDATGCQKLVVRNDARVSHNANIQGPINGTQNPTLPSWDGKADIARAVVTLVPEKEPVTVACNIHSWMKAYVRVFDHPYAAVSSVGADLKDLKKPVWEDLKAKDFGTFELKGVPVGAKVKLFAWHEALGHLLGPTGKDLTIDADEKKNAQEIKAELK